MPFIYLFIDLLQKEQTEALPLLGEPLSFVLAQIQYCNNFC